MLPDPVLNRKRSPWNHYGAGSCFIIFEIFRWKFTFSPIKFIANQRELRKCKFTKPSQYRPSVEKRKFASQQKLLLPTCDRMVSLTHPVSSTKATKVSSTKATARKVSFCGGLKYSVTLDLCLIFVNTNKNQMNLPGYSFRFDFLSSIFVVFSQLCLLRQMIYQKQQTAAAQ